MTKFFGNMSRYVVLVAAVLMALSVFGIETTSFAAVLAAAGFAIGMALQGTLGNFSAGVMLLTFRPIRVGDFVDVAGTAGSVQEVGIFSTILHTGDNARIGQCSRRRRSQPRRCGDRQCFPERRKHAVGRAVVFQVLPRFAQ